jgi:site-specific recombinase XerD
MAAQSWIFNDGSCILIYQNCTSLFTEVVHSYLPKLYITIYQLWYIAIYRLQTGKAFHPRSMQLVVTGAMKKAGFTEKGYTSHTLRHSFATHMLDNGSNIHVIKTLLGHTKLETTMVYLHLQQHTQFGIVSPMDKLLGGSHGRATT